jgi:hypothetical protein
VSAFEDAVIQRIKQLEREVERLQKWERAADLGLGKLSDPNADRVLFWDDSAGALQWLTIDGIVNTAFGQWQNYTVSWTASTTNPSIGNGLLFGKYVQIGKTVIYNIYLAPGSTTTFGSGQWYFSLPKAVSTNSAGSVGNWVAIDTGTNAYSGQIHITSGSNKMTSFIRDGIINYMSSTQPHTWANGDYLYISITYEIA